MIDNKYIHKDILIKRDCGLFLKHILFLPSSIIRNYDWTRAHISTSGRPVANISGALFLMHCPVSGTRPVLSV
jgi:hypothetical protein